MVSGSGGQVVRWLSGQVVRFFFNASISKLLEVTKLVSVSLVS